MEWSWRLGGERKHSKADDRHGGMLRSETLRVIMKMEDGDWWSPWRRREPL